LGFSNIAVENRFIADFVLFSAKITPRKKNPKLPLSQIFNFSLLLDQ